MKRIIYADNAATTHLDPDALEEMLQWMREEYGNPSQPYSFSRNPKRAIAEAREDIATCIGAKPEEIFFTSGGTESDNWAIKGTAFARSREGALLTSAFEHHAVLRSAEVIEIQRYPVAYMWPSKDGFITPDILSRYISDDTQMVSVMMVNNELGTIQPIKELCQIAHNHNAIFHTDAVQAVGHIPIDVNELDVDLLSASAHKFNGPRGVGFLYIRKGTNIEPYLNGGTQEKKHRAGTENTAGIVGMATALKNNCQNMNTIADHLRALDKQLIEGLDASGIEYIRNGCDPFLPGLLNISFPGRDGEAILHRMDMLGISISTGAACDSKETEISHVLRAIRLNDELARGTIRISYGKNNTIKENEDIIAALRTILHK